MTLDVQAYLKSVSLSRDSEIELGRCALFMGAYLKLDTPLSRYITHLSMCESNVATRYQKLIDAGAAADVRTRCAALKHVLYDQEDYRVDPRTDRDVQAADLSRTIERRIGGALVLVVLYAHIGRAQGWMVDVLNVAGCFLCRMEKDGERLIFDPVRGCKNLEAPALRALVKAQQGDAAELSASYFEPLSNRQVLIALYNQTKFKQIEIEAYDDALQTIELMCLIDADEYRLWLEAGILYARLNQADAAIDKLERYIEVAPHSRDRQEAQLLLSELRV